MAFPLGSLYVRVPYTNTSLRHLFSIITSLFFLLVVFHLNGGVAQLVGESAFTYVVARYVRSRQMPWIVFWVTMSHLMVNHAIRAWANIGYDTIEITGSQMVLTMKLTTFAWNVYDGRQNVAVCLLPSLLLPALRSKTKLLIFVAVFNVYSHILTPSTHSLSRTSTPLSSRRASPTQSFPPLSLSSATSSTSQASSSGPRSNSLSMTSSSLVNSSLAPSAVLPRRGGCQRDVSVWRIRNLRWACSSSADLRSREAIWTTIGY